MFFIKFPYYIDAPGGITDVSEKIVMKDSYKSKGSFNLAYVSEYDSNIITLFLKLFNKDWKLIHKDEVLLDNETASEYNTRDKLLMDEAVSNAIYVAYTKSNSDIKVLDNKVSVAYIYDSSKNDLKVSSSKYFPHINILKLLLYKLLIENLSKNSKPVV